MKPLRIVIPIGLMLLTGCVSAVTDCPVPTIISEEIQTKAATELEALPSGSALEVVLAAALDDRDKLRACRKIR